MRSCLIISLGIALLLHPLAASARNYKDFTYRYDAIWSSAIRLLRADRGYKINDKDKENGFVLFVYPGSGAVKECAASMQLINLVDEEGYKRIRAQLEIAHQPSYIELGLLDALENKLFEEQGRAPEAQKEKPKEEKKPDQKKERDDEKPAPSANK